MNIPCAVENDLAAHMAADAESDAMESEIQRRLEAMRGDGEKLFWAIGDMNDLDLLHLCDQICEVASAIDTDDRLAAVHELSAMIDRANLREATAMARAGGEE